MNGTSPPLRLALVRQRYTPFGGAERFMARAMGALQAQGVAVTVVARRWEGAAEGGITPLPCNPFHIGRWWRDWGFARCACRVLTRENFSLVQSHERIPCCDLYRAGDGLHRVWLANRARSIGPLARLATRLSPYHHYVLRAEERLFRSPRLRAVICNSRMVQREIIHHFGLPEERLPVIYSGVDTERFHPRLRAHRSMVREHWGIPSDAPLFLFVGSGFARKGVPAVLAALPPTAWLLVVGRDRKQRAMERLAGTLGVAERVRFTGGQREVAPFYGAADALVLPTLYDPFPNVALEGMAAGLPLVTSHQCGAADLITPGINGLLCDALDTATLRAHLTTLLPPAARQAMGEAARRTVEPLTLSAMAEQLTGLYRQLLAEGPAPHQR